MTVRVKWKPVGVLIVCLVFASCVATLYRKSLFSPSLITSSPTRKLMNENSCKGLEEQIERMHALMHTKEKASLKMVDRLRVENSETRRKLETQYEMTRDLERRNRQLIEKLSNLKVGTRRREDDYRLAPQIKPNTIRTLNIHQKSEFMVIPFTAFTKDRLYTLESGMINKPEVAPIGNKKEELSQVLEKSLEILNKPREGEKTAYMRQDLAQGYYRIDRMMGTQYELFYKSKDAMNVFEHVQLFRPFAPMQEVQVQSYDKTNEWINLIVPLSGRVESFEHFMEMFVEECIEKDKRVFLTVVYFGDEGKDRVKQILTEVAKEHDYESYKIIERKGKFSRGIGLLVGAEVWKDGNVLLFFCDVDIVFKPGFLDRCRLNAAPGNRVYYPIVFSLYNPSIVYSSRDSIPSWKDQLIVKRNSGFWRNFGFGMTCMYRSDFLFMRGFDTKIQGWGMEDVKLYRKIVQSSNLNVVRAPDPGIFHMWHEKTCDPHLPLVQYNMCLGSKALGEASHTQLGMLAFRELKKENELLHEEKEKIAADDLHEGAMENGDNDLKESDLDNDYLKK